MYELKDNCIVQTDDLPDDMTYDQALSYTRELWYLRTKKDHRKETHDPDPLCPLCWVDVDDCDSCPANINGCPTIVYPYLDHPTRANARKVVAAIDKYMEDNP